MTEPRAAGLVWIGLVLLALATPACTTPELDVPGGLRPALDDLAHAGFEFEADVRFARRTYTVCDRVSCAEVVWRDRRRVIVIAPEAFASPGLLRAALLEVWVRYRTPRPGSVRDLARGALRVVQDGSRAGIEDRHVLREAFRAYRAHWEAVDPARRKDLPDPETLTYP